MVHRLKVLNLSLSKNALSLPDSKATFLDCRVLRRTLVPLSSSHSAGVTVEESAEACLLETFFVILPIILSSLTTRILGLNENLTPDVLGLSASLSSEMKSQTN
jgi:hypothetical protein